MRFVHQTTEHVATDSFFFPSRSVIGNHPGAGSSRWRRPAEARGRLAMGCSASKAADAAIAAAVADKEAAPGRAMGDRAGGEEGGRARAPRPVGA